LNYYGFYAPLQNQRQILDKDQLICKNVRRSCCTSDDYQQLLGRWYQDQKELANYANKIMKSVKKITEIYNEINDERISRQGFFSPNKKNVSNEFCQKLNAAHFPSSFDFTPDVEF